LKIATLIAKGLLGLPFLLFGLNALHPFLPVPPLTGDEGQMMGLMIKHGWTLFLGVLYVVAAVLLLIGRYVPVALVLLGPPLVVILLFHITLAPGSLPLPVVLTALEIFLIYGHWPAFRGIFTAKME